MAPRSFITITHLVTVFLSILVLSLATSNAGASFTLGSMPLSPRDSPISTAHAIGNVTVGIRRETLSFDDRQLNVSWWYPSSSPSGSTAYVSSGGIVGSAFEDAPLLKSSEKYPFIVFSPGLSAHDDSYYFYCQNLASNGYIVVSINHLDATEAAIGANPTALARALQYQEEGNSSYTVLLLYSNWFRETHFSLTYRPQEIKIVLDHAIATSSNPTSPFNNAIDIKKIGLSGHSLGAFNTLLIGCGMAINCDKPLTPAQSNTNNTLLTEVSICAWPETKNLSTPTSYHDSRIKAVLALAPPLFITPEELPRAASSIKTPLLLITGTDPKFESTLEPQRIVYNSSSGDKYMVEIKDTNHFLISDASYFNDTTGVNVPDADKRDFEEKARVYMVYSAAFFDVYLKGFEARKEVLRTKSSGFVASLMFNVSEPTPLSPTLASPGSASEAGPLAMFRLGWRLLGLMEVVVLLLTGWLY